MKIRIDLKMDKETMILFVSLLFLCLLVILFMTKNNISLIQIDQYPNCNCSCPNSFSPYYSTYSSIYYEINKTKLEEWTKNRNVYTANYSNRCCYPNEINCKADCIYPIAYLTEEEYKKLVGS